MRRERVILGLRIVVLGTTIKVLGIMILSLKYDTSSRKDD